MNSGRQKKKKKTCLIVETINPIEIDRLPYEHTTDLDPALHSNKITEEIMRFVLYFELLNADMFS